MQTNKKYLLLLIAVPLSIGQSAVMSLFGAAFQWSNLLCFGVFTVVATILLVCNAPKLKALLFFVLHIAFLLSAVYKIKPFSITEEQVLFYGFYCMPELPVLAMLAKARPASFEKALPGEKHSQTQGLTALRILFDADLVLMLAILAVRLANGREKIGFCIDGVGVSFLLFALLFLLCLLRITRQKTKKKKTEVTLLLALLACSVFNVWTYAFCMYPHLENAAQTIFPLFLSALVLFESFPTVKETLFKNHT